MVYHGFVLKKSWDDEDLYLTIFNEPYKMSPSVPVVVITKEKFDKIMEILDDEDKENLGL